MTRCWAKNLITPRQVKSLAEIQAEEQERLAKVRFTQNILLDKILFKLH